jgi:hypothetical protein
LAFLVAWDAQNKDTSVDTIVHDGVRIAQLYAMTRVFSLWLPSVFYYWDGISAYQAMQTYLDKVAALVNSVALSADTLDQSSAHFNTCIHNGGALARYNADRTGTAHSGWLLALRVGRELEDTVLRHSAAHLPLYTLEACVSLCTQSNNHGHAIILLQGAVTLEAMRVLSAWLGYVINISALYKGTQAALSSIERQLADPTKAVHFLCGEARRRILGCQCLYSELAVCHGDDIIAAARQGDSPAFVVAQ